MNKKLLRWVGAFLLLDGVSLLSFGRTYVQLWQAEAAPSFYRRSIVWLLRGAGMAESILGLAVPART